MYTCSTCVLIDIPNKQVALPHLVKIKFKCCTSYSLKNCMYTCSTCVLTDNPNKQVALPHLEKLNLNVVLVAVQRIACIPALLVY